jgi:hypothetical protein
MDTFILVPLFILMFAAVAFFNYAVDKFYESWKE